MTTDYFITNTGERIPIVFTHRAAARNIILRPKILPSRELHVSLPKWTSVSRAMKFIAEKQSWLEKIYARAPVKKKFASGDVINLLGRDVMFVHKSCPHDNECSLEIITIGGAPEFFERRVRDEIKKQFLAAVKKEIAGVPIALRPTKIAVRDTTSRWGSCSSTGTISLSYRLAFAPPPVMRYVIMHEIAHRKYMDHSAKFYGLVGQLYGSGWERAKIWLSKNGQTLHTYF